MSEIINSNWFSEINKPFNTAFSLRLQTEKRLHHEQSAYQTIEIYDTTSFGKLMVIDGFIMLSSFDNFFYHEMLSHPALFTHPDPKNVVIIGGGDCGTLQQVLLHQNVQSAIQIEIDERVTRIAEQYFPELCDKNSDPRAHLGFEDGIAWMQNAKDASIDIIIVDSTDPIGPAEGLFNVAFYRNCQRVLRESGILVQQSESPLFNIELIRSMHQAMSTAGFNHTQLLPFPQPVYPSGWWSATMAAKTNILTQFREQDAAGKSFSTKYYNAGLHRGLLMGLPEFLTL